VSSQDSANPLPIDPARIERLDPGVASILRGKSGMERLRLAHEAWELARDRLALEYMIVGSHASIYYGEPRFTQDVDVVVELTPPALPGFLEQFPSADFYVSEETARDAVAQRGQFNIIHGASGVKIDVFITAGS